jgi:hypothetical protein
VEVEPWVAQQPALDRRGLVGGVVVEHQVKVKVVWDLVVDLLEERLELDGPVPSVQRRNDGATEPVENRERRRRAVPDAGVPGSIGSTGWKRFSPWIWDFSSTARTTACSGGSR